jgi:formate-dependent nitrite reductase membrane component NrfD
MRLWFSGPFWRSPALPWLALHAMGFAAMLLVLLLTGC